MHEQANPGRPWAVVFCTLMICATVVLVAWIRRPIAETRIEARVEKHERRMEKIEEVLKIRNEQE